MSNDELQELEDYSMADRPKAVGMEYFASGCTLIDMLVGGAKDVFGFPFGRILDITGDKSSGKTFLKNEFIANAYYTYKERFRWFSDDAESGDTLNSKKLYGFDIHPEVRKLSNRMVTDSHTLEEITDNPDKALLPMEIAIAEMTSLHVNELQAFRITSGVKTTLKGTLPGQYSLWYLERFLGVVTVEDEIVKPEKILYSVARPEETAEGQ